MGSHPMARRRAASNSSRIRGEVVPFMLARVLLIQSAIEVKAVNPRASAWRCRSAT